MVNTAALGIDDKHVLTNAIQTLDEVSPILVASIRALASDHLDTARLVAEIRETSEQVRPGLVANTSPDRWYEDVEGDDALDQVWELVDRARRQVEVLDAVNRICARLDAFQPATA